MKGLYISLIALLSLFVSYLWGKATGTKDANEKNASEKKTAEVQKAAAPIVAETVKKQTEATKDYEHSVDRIGPGLSTDDMGRISAEMAQKALSMGAKEAK